MRCAVVGHVEWVEFVRVPALPAAGQIVQGELGLAEPAGGGAVIARQIARLAGRCEFFTALGDDDLGRRAERRLAELGVDVHVQRFGETRRAWVHVDARRRAHDHTAQRRSCCPRGPLPLDGYDAVFFVSGDAEALRSARRAPFVAATARELPTLREASVPLDLLVGSAQRRRASDTTARSMRERLCSPRGRTGARRTANDTKPRRCRDRSATRTARATRSRRRCALRSRAATRWPTRSRLRRVLGPQS